ncbi:MAG: hypothetical protein KME60_23175 [Cyanomargarita calcarea GSE-NOS-MK-12-04C]|uniref:Uncharacterized protein n=1 Tax=Cyanomargarita calcarea GSE-NOS-MK-12-04C TaxID=2839659 RepID=A0A951QPP9_9CYAN|nr:hypothetical protein [Cyanomargarita calcarea GSE-NOS-MK-12-04C]
MIWGLNPHIQHISSLFCEVQFGVFLQQGAGNKPEKYYSREFFHWLGVVELAGFELVSQMWMRCYSVLSCFNVAQAIALNICV